MSRPPIASYRVQVYRAPMDVETENPWCASMPFWPAEAWLRSDDGFYRTYLPNREMAMRFVNWNLLSDRKRLREWATHYRYQLVLDFLDSK